MAGLQRLKKIPNPAWYSMAIVMLALSIFGLITICVVWYYANELVFSYGVIIDAGSTSSKIYLYRWPEIASRTNGEVSEVKTCKSTPGISDYMEEPTKAVDNIEKCLENEITPFIPARLRKKSFLYLGATAGMRLIQYRNPEATKLIFQAVEGYLLKTGYKMRPYLADVKVISESVEGIAAWISVNYLKGILQRSLVSGLVKKKVKKTFGALDLGGASTQITFVPNETTSKNGMSLIRLYGADYNVYSHSYLCYGKSSAENRFLAFISQQWLETFDSSNVNAVIVNPCMKNGDSEMKDIKKIVTYPCVTGDYAKEQFGISIDLPEDLKNKSYNVTFKGSGNPQECQNFIKKLFNTQKCSHGTCGFNDIYQPRFSADDKFMAFAGYYMMYSILQNNSDTLLDYNGYLDKAFSVCKQNQTEFQDSSVLESESEDKKYKRWRCFGFLYVYQLLTSLGFNKDNWQSIIFTKSINDATLAWSLGYMINKTSMIPIEKPVLRLRLETFVAILLICLVMICVGCICAIISYKLYRSDYTDGGVSEQKELKTHLHDNTDEEIASKV